MAVVAGRMRLENPNGRRRAAAMQMSIELNSMDMAKEALESTVLEKESLDNP